MRILLAIGLAVCLCPRADAAVKIGYASLPGELGWVTRVGGAHLNKTEGVSQGVITLGVDSMRQMTGSISLGISTGIGLPAGDIEFDRTKEYTTVGGVNANEGDKTVVALTTVPVLAQACYTRPLGAGNFSLELGLGAVLVGLAIENTETYWWDGMAQSAYRSALTDVKMAIQTSESIDFTPLFAVQVAPCYSIGISEKDSLGIQVPLAYLANVVMNRTKMDYEPTFAAPGDSDPLSGGLLIGGDEVEFPSFEVGGFSWGVNIVYTRKL